MSACTRRQWRRVQKAKVGFVWGKPFTLCLRRLRVRKLWSELGLASVTSREIANARNSHLFA